MTFNFSGPVTITGLADAQFAALQTKLVSIEGKVNTILMDEKLVLDALDKIDVATTKAAGNLQILADTDQVIATEMAAQAQLLKELQAAGTPGVTQALVDRAVALVGKSQGVSDQLDAMVPVLQGIAAQGATNPVPLPIPPAPPAAPPLAA